MVLVDDDELSFLQRSVYLDATTLPRRSEPTLRVAPGRIRRPGTIGPLQALAPSASAPELRNPAQAAPLLPPAQPLVRARAPEPQQLPRGISPESYQFITLLKHPKVQPGRFAYFQPTFESPYDLRPLTALEARRSSNFCTISAKGVTSEREGEMEFIPLDPWLDEAARFTELTSMRFFVQFRRWKAYQRLHSMTRGRAVGRVRKALSLSAFIVDPDLQRGLLDLGAICERMRGAVLFGAEDFAGSRSADEFVQAQQEQLQRGKRRLAALLQQAREVVNPNPNPAPNPNPTLTPILTLALALALTLALTLTITKL